MLLDAGADPNTAAPGLGPGRALRRPVARAEGFAALGAAISIADTTAIRLLLDAVVYPGRRRHRLARWLRTRSAKSATELD